VPGPVILAWSVVKRLAGPAFWPQRRQEGMRRV